MVFFSYNLLHDVMMQLDFVFEKHNSSRMKNVVLLRKGQALLTDEFSYYTVYVLLLTGRGTIVYQSYHTLPHIITGGRADNMH